jgi:WD40 repeat protein
MRVAFSYVFLAATALRSIGAEAGARVAPQAMVLLKANCFGCHNEEKKKGGLLLTSRNAMLKGSENGPVVALGKPDESKLIQVLEADADPHMPPKKQLGQTQISVLRTWVDSGATWDEKALAKFGRETPVDKVGVLPLDFQPVLAVSLSPDEKQLAVARGATVVIYETASTNGVSAHVLKGHQDAVQALAWSADGKRLASATYRQVFIWSTSSWKGEQRLIEPLEGRVTALKFSPDGSTLAGVDGTPTKRGMVRLWDTASWKLRSTWEAHRDSIMALDFSHDAKLLATGSADKLVKIWSVSNQVEIAKLEAHGGHVLGVQFSPDDLTLASVGADKVLNIWDVKTREQKITLPKHPAPLTGIAWAADGKSLVSVSEDGQPRIYSDFKAHSGKEQSEGAQTRALSAADEVLYCVSVSRDGKTVYGGAHDGKLYIWSSDGKLKRKLEPIPASGQLAVVEGTK